jgi:hypothetical protein
VHAFFGADVPEDTLHEQNASLGAQNDYVQFLTTQAIMNKEHQDAARAQASFYGVET